MTERGARPPGRRPPPPGRAGAAARSRPSSSPSSRSPSSPCRSSGCCGRRRGVTRGRSSRRTARSTALRLSLWCSLWATVAALVFGVPLAWLLARVRVPRPGPGARAVHAVDGAAAGRRRRRPVLRARPARPGRPVPRPVVRLHAAVHDRRRRSSPRPSSPCRSWSSPSRPPSASSTSATRTRPARSARRAGTCSAASPCPAIRPGLVAGAVLAWARALGEFGATITFAGNFPAAPRPCRWPSTWPTRSTPTKRSC